MTDANDYVALIRWVRVARGLEAGGFYNAAKLLWAAAFSTAIRAGTWQGAPTSPDTLDREMTTAIQEIQARGAKPELIAALEQGRAGARENRTIPASDIPRTCVCRTCGEIMLGDEPRHCPVCGAHVLTFREFLPVYFLEPLEPTVALAALTDGPAEVELAIQGLTEEQMQRPPSPHEWAIRDLLLHILVAEGLISVRVKVMLEENNPSLQGVAAWNIREEALPAREILERYRALRHATVERLKSMSAQGWWRTARHEEFGQFTILQQASYFAKHERYHLPQVAEIRKAIGA